ncbi:MAG: hypothetical protein ABH846_01150 [Patescibacteria group bacterium]
MRTISLPRETPRDLSRIDINFRYGLMPYYLLAGFFFISMILLDIMVIIFDPSQWWVLLIVTVIIYAFAYLLFYMPADKRYKTRILAVRDGTLCEGKVAEKKKVFVPWKSWRDHVIVIESITRVGMKQAKLQTGNSQIADQIKTGDIVHVFCDEKTGSVFIPLEIGIQIK